MSGVTTEPCQSINNFDRYFSEKTTPNDFEKMSIEDKRFLKLMDEKVKFFDGHCVLPLPLKNPTVNDLNNRIQAVKRAKSQTRASKGRKDAERLLYIHEQAIRKVLCKEGDKRNQRLEDMVPHHVVAPPRSLSS